MSTFQDPPTWAEIVLTDKVTGKPKFNPVWLDWFLGISQNFTAAGSVVLSGVQGSANRIPFGAADGSLTDDADFTYDSSTDTLLLKNMTVTVSARSPTVYISAAATPATPSAGDVVLYAQDAAGVARLRALHSSGNDLALFRDQVVRVRNNSGGTINKGEAVTINGSSGNFPTVIKAKANAAATMPSHGIMLGTTNTASFGTILIDGEITGLNTSGFAEGDILYVSETTAGALTNAEPGWPYLSQPVAVVTVSSVGNGKLHCFFSVHHEGDQFGTNRNTWNVGDGAAGAKTVAFKNTKTGNLQWNPTDDRTITLPDATGTVLLGTTLDGDKGDITVSGSGATWTIDANVVTYAKLQQASAGFTIMAKADTGAGNYAELAAGNSTVLRRSGAGNLAFGTLVTANIGNSQVTYAKIQNVSATDKLLGRSTAGAGVVEEITCTPFARSVLDDADAATVLATIGAEASGTAAAAVAAHAALQTGVHGLNITTGKTLNVSNTLTLTATDGSTLAIGAGGTLGSAAYTASTAYEAAGSIATHAALLTGVHGLNITAGKTFNLSNTLTLTATDGSTLAIGTGGTLGTAAYTASTAYDAAGAATTVQTNLNTHAALTGSAAHGLGTISTQNANAVAITGGSVAATTGLSNTQAGSMVKSSGTGATGGFEIQAVTGSADINRWQWKIFDATGTLRLQALTDAGGGGGSVIDIIRTTNQIDQVRIGSTTTPRFIVDVTAGTVTINCNTVIGDAAGDTLTISPNAVTWSNNPTHSGNHTFSGNVSIEGNTTIGNAAGDTWTANASTLAIPNGLNIDSNSLFIDSSLVTPSLVIGHSASVVGGTPSTPPFLSAHSTGNPTLLGGFCWNSVVGGSAIMEFNRSISGAIGTHTLLTNGTAMGTFRWTGSDGSAFPTGANMTAVTTQDWTASTALGTGLELLACGIGTATRSRGIVLASGDTITYCGIGQQFALSGTVYLPEAMLHVGYGASGTAAARSEVRIQRGTSNAATLPILSFYKNRGNSLVSPTAITAGDDIGRLSFAGYVGATGLWVEGARIFVDEVGAISDATTGLGMNMQFHTRTTGGSLTEAVRILDTQDVAIVAAKKLYLDGVAGTGDTYIVESSANTLDLVAGGTTALTLTASSVVLNPGAGDIKWNKALVALGGGAAPTFGTIGGSGPAAAGQNSWMQVQDSTGATFWVPTWK